MAWRSAGSIDSVGNKAASVGERSSIPKRRKEGFSWVESCGVFLYAPTGHLREIDLTAFQTWLHVFVVLPLVFDSVVRPYHLPAGWYVVVFSLVMPNSWCIRCESKFVPLSDSEASDTLNVGTTSSARGFAILVGGRINERPFG